MDKKQKRETLIILLLGIVICLLLIRWQGCGENKEKNPAFQENIGGGVELAVDPGAEEEKESPGSALEEGVVIAGRGALTFPADQKEVPVDLYNPEDNAEMYYLTFELRLLVGEEYETLYTSGLVEPGKHLYRITLSRELEPGVYEAVIHVQPYRMDEERKPTNNADMRIRLYVVSEEEKSL